MGIYCGQYELQAQRQKDAGLKALDQGKLKAQEHAQLAADMANRKAAELAHNVSVKPFSTNRQSAEYC